MTYQITRSEAQELAPILEAYGEGKIIQCKAIPPKSWVCLPCTPWRDLVASDGFAPTIYEYRIKPEPVSRPFKSLEEVIPHIGKLVRWTSTMAQMITGAHYSNGVLYLDIGTDCAPADGIYRQYSFIDSGKPVGYYEEFK